MRYNFNPLACAPAPVKIFGGGTLVCPAAADVNADSKRNMSDAIHLLLHLFSGGPAPVGEPLTLEECVSGAP